MNKQQLIERIKTHIAKSDQYKDKSDQYSDKSEQHAISAGQCLKTLKAEHADTWAEWETLLKTKIGISTGRASELMQVADGRKTVEKLRADKAESVRQVRARASSLRSEETTALVKAEQAPADDPAASAENMKAQFAALDEDAAKVDDDGGAEGAELNRFTRRVQKFHTEFYNVLGKLSDEGFEEAVTKARAKVAHRRAQTHRERAGGNDRALEHRARRD
jgi:hypothetical protein